MYPFELRTRMECNKIPPYYFGTFIYNRLTNRSPTIAEQVTKKKKKHYKSS